MPEKFYVGNKILLTNKDKVLLLKGYDSAGRFVWDLPGGRMEADETVEEGLRREVDEELPGVKDLNVYESIATFKLPVATGDKVQVVINIFKATADITNASLSQEHTEMRWVDAEEFEKIQASNEAILHEPFILPIQETLLSLAKKN